MADRMQHLADSSTESSLSTDSNSSSDGSECTSSTWRYAPRFSAFDKGKALATLRPGPSLYDALDDENPPGASPRSVQTAFSVAESIGYSTDFVLPSEEEQQPIEPVLSEGMTMAALLCWTTVIVLVVASSCYVVQNMVA